MCSVAPNQPPPKHSICFPEYFTALARNYAAQTGDTTRSLFAQSFEDIQSALPITQDSKIHDNAAGPGTAASVLVDRLGSELPSVLVTDSVPAMVDAARDSFLKYPTVKAEELDALDLKTIQDGTFTHSILNFSIFTFKDPLKGLQEIHRTLKDGGVAALTTWKRFGAGEIVHGAQRIIRGDKAELMVVPRTELMQEGVFAKLVEEAGFESTNTQVLEKSLALKDPELEGLRDFLLGQFTLPARKGYTEEEEKQWPEAVARAIQQEMEKFGGVKFEAWVIIAKK